MEIASAEVRSGGHPTGWSIFLGVVLMIAGLVAIMAPLFAGIAASIFFGWLLMVGGVAHLIYAWSERGAGAIIWQILIGVVYLIAAFYLFASPVSGVISLTLIFAIYIAMEGIMELGLYFRIRARHGAGYFLLDGVVSLLLAGLVFFHWPLSSAWFLGTIVGISLIFSGIARLTLPMGRRRLLPV
jgi:uncharacterized membrane protein HdeD (DUF308 family)